MLGILLLVFLLHLQPTHPVLLRSSKPSFRSKFPIITPLSPDSSTDIQSLYHSDVESTNHDQIHNYKLNTQHASIEDTSDSMEFIHRLRKEAKTHQKFHNSLHVALPLPPPPTSPAPVPSPLAKPMPPSPSLIRPVCSSEIRFTKVYDNNLWLDKVSRSGIGSNPSSDAVKMDIAALDRIFDFINPTKIIDVPCGDMAWVPIFLKDKNIEYKGYDIVPSIIKKNKESHPLLYFEIFNAITQVLPQTDVVLCRDLLNHLSISDIKSVLHNFIQSGNEYFIISNNKGAINEEKKMENGDSRPIDITTYPFSFGKIIMEFDHLSLFYIS